MRKTIMLVGGGAALFLFACLVAPDEPAGTSVSALTCGTTERAFNGACRKVCATNADCNAAGASCMKVSGGTALCLDYKHCAYLGSDTQCGGATVGYASYASGWGGGDFGHGAFDYNPYGYGTYGYTGPAGCAGDATWQVLAPSGEPQCGAQHTVTRCASIAGECALVDGAATDVADQ